MVLQDYHLARSLLVVGTAVMGSLSLAVACHERRELPTHSVQRRVAARSTEVDSGRSPANSAVGASPAARSVASGTATDAGLVRSLCREQPPLEWLVNAHLRNGPCSRAEAVERRAALTRSIRYRTQNYGYYEGFGNPAWNPKPPSQQIRLTTFFGIPVKMHERVIPALRCVEEQLRRECREPYQPQILSGFRRRNTYLSGEVSNHVYGIALDIDPEKNPCCGCVEPWRSNKRCKGKRTVTERMEMPECWVAVFERYGFYWLGHDELEDSMHFEFLGDPATALAASPTAP